MPPGHPPVGQQPAGHGTASRPAAADPFVDAADAGKTAMASATPSDPERVVLAGEIAIDPAVPLGESSTVYVIAVYAPQDRAPVLVKRFEKPKFPLAFELREKDSQMGPRQADRPLYLRAMISDGGDVMKNRNRTTSETAFQPFTKDAKLTIK
jgi:hypothetical protein